jgi:hypothetical protein
MLYAIFMFLIATTTAVVDKRFCNQNQQQRTQRETVLISLSSLDVMADKINMSSLTMYSRLQDILPPQICSMGLKSRE